MWQRLRHFGGSWQCHPSVGHKCTDQLIIMIFEGEMDVTWWVGADCGGHNAHPTHTLHTLKHSEPYAWRRQRLPVANETKRCTNPIYIAGTALEKKRTIWFFTFFGYRRRFMSLNAVLYDLKIVMYSLAAKFYDRGHEARNRARQPKNSEAYSLFWESKRTKPEREKKTLTPIEWI